LASRIWLKRPDRLGGEVVAAHQQVRGRHRRRSLQLEVPGDRDLVVEHEAVFPAAGERVQADAQVLEDAFVQRDAHGLVAGDEVPLRERLPRRAEARGAREPDHHLQVAQSPGTLLDVGLEVVGGVHEALVAALLLLGLGVEERAHVAARAQPRVELEHHRHVARDQARLDEARVHGHVLGRLLDALGNGAHAVPGLEAQVPEQVDEVLDRAARLLPVGNQDEHVDVRMREQGAAPVAAHGDERRAGLDHDLGPELGQGVVDLGRGLGEQARRIGPHGIFGLGSLALGLEPAAQLDGGRRRRGDPSGCRSGIHHGIMT
jgi:hypothetical protein